METKKLELMERFVVAFEKMAEQQEKQTGLVEQVVKLAERQNEISEEIYKAVKPILEPIADMAPVVKKQMEAMIKEVE